MMRITRMLYTAWIAILPFALIPATIANAQTPKVPEMTSTGLVTFSEHDRAMRVAIVFTEMDDAVVETTLRFVDSRGDVLKVRRGTLRYGAPFITDLTRADVGGQADVLVRAEVYLELPGMREVRYPILITLQPISEDGFGRCVIDWNGGLCGCPTCSGPENPGKQVNCPPPKETLPKTSP